MKDVEIAQKRLFTVYGSSVICRSGSGEKVEYNATTENYHDADVAVYINKDYQLAAVWDLKRRRQQNRIIKNLSLPGKWKDIQPPKHKLKAVYKRMGKDASAPYEKVLVVHMDDLIRIIDVLHLYLSINPEDDEFPPDLDLSTENQETLLPRGVRERVSTTRWNRNDGFREIILTSYGRKCAICRCDEERILEAAHIIAVADGGSDDISNGICLCANHHLMLDSKLITIDFETNTLSFVSDSVKKMPWYPHFQEVYEGKTVIPKN